jgi:hypothetical protein
MKLISPRLYYPFRSLRLLPVSLSDPVSPSLPDRRRIKSLESENLEDVRRRLVSLEGKRDEHYFRQIFKLFPEKLRPEARRDFQAYDGINNTPNLAYEILSWKVPHSDSKSPLCSIRLRSVYIEPVSSRWHPQLFSARASMS